ncbi:MAG: hypothetical protein KatS3mg008_0673 [Acidimicrobiales bacterium]|nr:MAG: hypothetical protein KatS3mg008_0673 [Acidimicrobiales bacterium]
MVGRHRRFRPQRPFARTERVAELLREIIAEELERVGEGDLELVTVTAVDVTEDLEHAVVRFATVSDTGLRGPSEGEDDLDERVHRELDRLRPHLQKLIAAQARLRRVPRLSFRVDQGLRNAARVDEILRSLVLGRDGGPVEAETEAAVEDDDRSLGERRRGPAEDD